MLDPSLPPGLAAALKDYERRLRALENSPRLTQASVRDGTLTVLDADGNVVVELGMVDTCYGLRLRTVSGRAVFSTLASGCTRPVQQIPVAPAPNANVGNGAAYRLGTISPTLAELYRGDFWSTGPTIEYDFRVYPNGGTKDWTMYVYERVMSPVAVLSATGVTATTQYASTPTIGSGSLNGGTDPAGRQMTVRLHARVSGGAPVTVDIGARAFSNYG